MQGIVNRVYREAFSGFTHVHTATYRLTGGRIGGRIRGAPVVLLHHVGRRSGKQRTSPLLYLPDGDDVVVIGSKGGSHKHPAWWLNLREMDETEIELPGERRRVKVRVATPEERERLWPKVVEIWPDYAKYQQRTEREIPLGILSPAG
jgi:deazaflavin-dependent oxidoreductase (nitroreductase family)